MNPLESDGRFCDFLIKITDVIEMRITKISNNPEMIPMNVMVVKPKMEKDEDVVWGDEDEVWDDRDLKKGWSVEDEDEMTSDDDDDFESMDVESFGALFLLFELLLLVLTSDDDEWFREDLIEIFGDFPAEFVENITKR